MSGLPRTNWTRQHVAKYLTIDGRRVRIDANIAPLIDGLQRLGIMTFSSCGASCGGCCDLKHRLISKRAWMVERYGPDRGKRITYWKYSKPKQCENSVWLVFETTADAARFLNVCSRPGDPEDLRDMMKGQFGYRGKPSLSWKWKSHVDDLNDRRYMDHRGYWVGQRQGNPKFDFYMYLVFPHAHLDLVTERVLARCKKDGV